MPSSMPPVSIIWVNYNSMHIRGLVGRSLKAISDLDYPDYELVIVDNGSTDGSYDYIRDIARDLPIDVKLVRLEHNLGFTGGNNIGFMRASKDSEYIVLLNNDAIPYSKSLKKLVSVSINKAKIASVQGVLLRFDNPKLIDNAGCMLNELLIPILLYSNEHTHRALRGLPRYITYPNGAYSLIRRSAIEECLGEVPFIWEGFMYFDDMYLGLKLWNCGYRVASIPVYVGLHRRGSSSRKPSLTLYYGIRGWIALNHISNSRYRNIVYKAVASRALKVNPLDLNNRSYLTNVSYLMGLMDGIRLGEYILEKYRLETIDIYKAPIVRVDPLKSILSLAMIRLSIY